MWWMTFKQAPRGEGIHQGGPTQQVPAHRVQEDPGQIARDGLLQRGGRGVGET